jgi:hypothetical protein
MHWATTCKEGPSRVGKVKARRKVHAPATSCMGNSGWANGVKARGEMHAGLNNDSRHGSGMQGCIQGSTTTADRGSACGGACEDACGV